MTFEQFQATRVWSDNLNRSVPDACWGDAIECGWVYLGSLYIEQVLAHWPAAARTGGKWHLIICNEERISDDLEALERHLYEYAQSEELTVPQAAAIADHWVKRLGLAFHPDTRGTDYETADHHQLLTDDEAADYAEDIATLHRISDPYDEGIAAWRRAGLIPWS